MTKLRILKDNTTTLDIENNGNELTVTLYSMFDSNTGEDDTVQMAFSTPEFVERLNDALDCGEFVFDKDYGSFSILPLADGVKYFVNCKRTMRQFELHNMGVSYQGSIDAILKELQE